ncbi:MAG TPA: hypothetical protein VFW87_18880 [Pirellulales bacterium]|nr:hypothetical protein [Pirellulales bacterium]
MPVRIDQIVLPGGELEAKPIESRQVPIVLRVVATHPHGSAFRYDLEYHGLEPGRYDLGDYLQRKDGAAAAGLPKLPVEIVSLMPAGQILPADPAARPAPRLGGYRLWLLLGMLAWFAGLLAILFARRRARLAQQRAVERPLTLAERLRPLVTAAMNGRLSPQGTAEIERLLLSYWRHRLHLDDEDPRVAVTMLRDHEQAGALLRQVEAWLHKPGAAEEVHLSALLAPYRDLPAETPLERGAGAPPQAAGTGGRP